MLVWAPCYENRNPLYFPYMVEHFNVDPEL